MHRELESPTDCQMKNRPPEMDETEIVRFDVPLDLETVAWLMAVCEGACAPPSAVLASMIKGIREDDEAAHDMATVARPQNAHLN